MHRVAVALARLAAAPRRDACATAPRRREIVRLERARRRRAARDGRRARRRRRGRQCRRRGARRAAASEPRPPRAVADATAFGALAVGGDVVAPRRDGGISAASGTRSSSPTDYAAEFDDIFRRARLPTIADRLRLRAGPRRPGRRRARTGRNACCASSTRRRPATPILSTERRSSNARSRHFSGWRAAACVCIGAPRRRW